MALLTCENLSIGYGSHIIQKDLNITITSGEYFVITGENGTGKSTLIKTILGFQKPLAGSITFSKELDACSIGYLPQQNASLKDFPATVREIVLSGMQGNLGLFPFYTKQDKMIVLQNMQKLGIEHLADKSFYELSGGQQQRVLLARALCAAKDMLLLDEPVKGFDTKITQTMYEDIEQLNKNGMTIIMITHDLAAAERYGTQVLRLTRDRSER
ncbi:MAG: ATP-binding cassette domain-containing protein [Spirochaetaceae bacterium]|nr:ATP-binding cassette domain-containing protein [Spirochaetaceae bacterium]